jgi:hypothetical protein
MRALFLSILLTCGLVAVAYADTPEYEKQELMRYQKYAGAPVNEFSMFELFRWQVVGPEKLVAWSTIRDAYLITVDKPCIRLEWANGLSLTQAQKWKVSKSFDFVEFEKQRCKIMEIRPIDLAALRKDNPQTDEAGGTKQQLATKS